LFTLSICLETAGNEALSRLKLPLNASEQRKAMPRSLIAIEASQPKLPVHTSPRKALAIAASEATDERPFKTQLLYLLPEVTTAAPADSSKAATEATTEAAKVLDSDDDTEDGGP
jgi:hypothetical protein